MNLYLIHTPIESLPKLEHVGGSLDLYKSKIKSLTKLEHVGGILDLVGTPLSKTITEEELRDEITVGGKIFIWK